MTLDTGVITALFAGLAAVSTATRARSAGVSRRDLRVAQRYGLAADRWIYVLERELARRGIPVPDGKPQELLDDVDPAAPPGPPAVTGA